MTVRLHLARSARLPAGVTPTLCGADVADWELATDRSGVGCGICLALAPRAAGPAGRTEPDTVGGDGITPADPVQSPGGTLTNRYGPSGAPPKGDWQPAGPTLTECARHRGGCAYRQGDPDRCDYCHVSWQAAARWPEWAGKAGHLADHAQVDALLALARDKRRQDRAE